MSGYGYELAFRFLSVSSCPCRPRLPFTATISGGPSQHTSQLSCESVDLCHFPDEAFTVFSCLPKQKRDPCLCFCKPSATCERFKSCDLNPLPLQIQPNIQTMLTDCGRIHLPLIPAVFPMRKLLSCTFVFRHLCRHLLAAIPPPQS